MKEAKRIDFLARQQKRELEKQMPSNQINKMFFPHDCKSNHVKALDGLRGIAILLVIIYHGGYAIIDKLAAFPELGRFGVYLFFILSAYLLDRQIALAFINKKASQGYWKNYMLRRFLRIYPLFAIALCLHWLANYLGLGSSITTIVDIPQHLLLQKGESIFWSIPVELKYYFVSPLILWYCDKFLNWDKAKVLLTLCLIMASALIVKSCFDFSVISLLKFLPIFLIGTIISAYEILYKDKASQAFSKKLFFMAGMLVIATASITIGMERFFDIDLNILSVLCFPLTFGCGILFMSAKYGNGLVQKMLEWKVLRFLGTISFSLYLFHMLFLRYAMQLQTSVTLKLVLFFVTSVLFSSVTYLLIERPLSKIRWANSSTDRPG